MSEGVCLLTRGQMAVDESNCDLEVMGWPSTLTLKQRDREGKIDTV